MCEVTKLRQRGLLQNFKMVCFLILMRLEVISSCKFSKIIFFNRTFLEFLK